MRMNIPDLEIWSSEGDNTKPAEDILKRGNKKGEIPEANEHNFQMNRSDQNQQYILRNAKLPYDPNETYAKDAVVYIGADEYISLSDKNKGNNPLTEKSKWKYIELTASDVGALSVVPAKPASGIDIDTLITTETYMVVNGKNKPEGSSGQGMVEVLNDSSITSQYYREWNSGYSKQFYRTRSASGSWDDWQLLYTSKTTPNASASESGMVKARHDTVTKTLYMTNDGTDA